MRDNCDGLSTGARLGKPIQGWDLGAKVLSFVDDTSNSFVLNHLREIGGGLQTPFNWAKQKSEFGARLGIAGKKNRLHGENSLTRLRS